MSDDDFEIVRRGLHPTDEIRLAALERIRERLAQAHAALEDIENNFPGYSHDWEWITSVAKRGQGKMKGKR